MQLVIQPDGAVRCLYDEAIDLHTLGRPVIARGSHVEPDQHGRWFADMAPCNGPKFDNRSDALAAEHGWLEANWLTPAD